jgi:hypothetical protein
MKPHNRRATLCAQPKKILKGMLLAALASMAMLGSAHAQTKETLTFESVQNVVTPVLAAGDTAYNTGDAFREAGFTARVLNPAGVDPTEVSLLGALIDGSNPFACSITSCPSGNSSIYFAGLNDGSLNLSRDDGLTFMIDGLSFAFVAPVAGTAGGSYGQLHLTGTLAGGGTATFSNDFPAGQDAMGNFLFDDFLLGSFSSNAFTSLSINACLFDGTGGCSFDHFNLTQNQAQFAIDNVQLGVVPEPAPVALMLLGLAGITLVARRRSN